MDAERTQVSGNTTMMDSDSVEEGESGFAQYYYYAFFWKSILLLWDLSGVVVQGLGVDMLWHGVEINHAVYSLLLQDVVLCWASSLLWWIFNWWWWRRSYIVWAQMYILFCALPIVFHDTAWAAVAYLRWFNITDNDGWLQLDQGVLRLKWTGLSWLATAVHFSILVPVCHWIWVTPSLRFMLSPILFVITVLPSIVAFIFYLRILRYARALAEDEAGGNGSVAARQSAAENGNAGPRVVAGVADIVVPLERTDHAVAHDVNAVFDDSDDDDLLDPMDSPSAKQAGASYLALKTMLLVGFFRHCSLAAFAFFAPYSNFSLVAVTTVASLLRHPMVLCVTVFNFGPIRSTFSIYVDNLPEHLLGLTDPIVDWFQHLKIGSQEDQRSIVQAVATSEAPSFHGQNSGVGISSGGGGVGVGIGSLNTGSVVGVAGGGGSDRSVVQIQQSPSKPSINCRDSKEASRASSSNGSVKDEKVLPNVQC